MLCFWRENMNWTPQFLLRLCFSKVSSCNHWWRSVLLHYKHQELSLGWSLVKLQEDHYNELIYSYIKYFCTNNTMRLFSGKRAFYVVSQPEFNTLGPYSGSIMTRLQVPPKDYHRDRIPYVKAKHSSCVQYIVTQSTSSSVGFGFYHSRNCGEGFQSFKEDPWLADLCLGVSWWKGGIVCCAKVHQVILSIVIGTLGISFGTFGTFPLNGPFLGDLSLWSLMESGNLKFRPPLCFSWLGPTVSTSQGPMTGLSHRSCLPRSLRGCYWDLRTIS